MAIPRSDFEHGTYNGYCNKGCRCDDCKSANTVYRSLRKSAIRDEKYGTVGTCPICLRTSPLVWDHDHLTGLTRGWICQPCNSMLGMFRDDTHTLERAIGYLNA